MATANIYLTFDGNCEAAFTFYKSIFGGEFPYLGRFKDMPLQEGIPPLTEEMKEKIMHVSLPIGNGTVIMGSDAGGDWAPKIKQGNNFSISVTAESREEADRLFAGLTEGGQVTMPLAVTFWGEYFGMCTDRFGINWMVGFRIEQK